MVMRPANPGTLVFLPRKSVAVGATETVEAVRGALAHWGIQPRRIEDLGDRIRITTARGEMDEALTILDNLFDSTTADYQYVYVFRPRSRVSRSAPLNRLKGLTQKGWITIGGSPGEEGENEGGTHVFIDDSGKIARGPAALTGRHISDVDQDKLKPGEKPKPPKKPEAESEPRNRLGGKVGRKPRSDEGDENARPSADRPPEHQPLGRGDAEDGAGMASAPGRPRDAADGETGADPGESARAEAAPDVPGGGRDSVAARQEHKETLKRIKGYADRFRKNGMASQAEWLDQLHEHVSAAGADAVLEALGEERGGDPVRVQYGGAYDELGETERDTAYIRSYLDKAGITVLHSGSTVDPSVPVISALPGQPTSDAPGGFAPTSDFFENKLEESRNLPGLESSEDIHDVVGERVTQFTPEVVAKLDAKYGKGKWIVKSYGEEAYAGFGIYFPQRVKQIQSDAKAVLTDARLELKDMGYKLGKDGASLRKGDKTITVGSPEFADLPKAVQRYAKQAFIASQAANGAVLPSSPEDSIRNEYGIIFRRNDEGVPIGITNWDGKDYDFDDPAYKKVESIDGGACGYAVKRAREADEWRRQGYQNEPKFMVQPAFEAVGVSDYDRAMGNTWETAKEGRVHCVTRDGKASAIPYATLVGRGDDLPAVIPSEDSRAMERAVEEAINQLPESKRRGQVYAPDVMKTKDGWRVIELNPSEEGGGSDWLGRNPFVIDALVSHLTGREPQHVKFIRDLLKGKDVEVPPLPAAAPGVSGAPRTAEGNKGIRYRAKAADEGSARGKPCQPGQTASRSGCIPAAGGSGSASKPPKQETEEPGKVYTIRAGNYQASYSLHANKRIDGPSIPLKNYKQRDTHSCGFVAALTVSQYLSPGVPPKDVLRAVQPSKSSGIDGKSLVAALKSLGVRAEFRKDLTMARLRRLVEKKVPVLVTVYPEDWVADHWTVVQGFDKERIYLTNYKSLPIAQFLREWYDRGEGLVCQVSAKKDLGRTVAVLKSGIINRLRLKSEGSCKPGQTSAQTGCTPEEGSTGVGASGSESPAEEGRPIAQVTPSKASGQWQYADPLPSHDSWRELPAEPGYVYHATSTERLADIQEGGSLLPHRPWHGTDQREWPDGATERRSYYATSPSVAWQFAPEEGKPVLTRVRRTAGFRDEGTGDVYLENKKLPADRLEVLTADGWKPLRQKESAKSYQAKDFSQEESGPIAAGLAVVAADTGRVLMIQRPFSGDDPNSGKWEFPGGRLEEGESPADAALREWQEETGLEPPPVNDLREWQSSDGKYIGYVSFLPGGEAALDLNARNLASDPDSEVGGVLAWVSPRDLPQHNLRPALLSDVDEVLAKITKWLLARVMKDHRPRNRLKGETVMDLDPHLTLRFPINRLGSVPDQALK